MFPHVGLGVHHPFVATPQCSATEVLQSLTTKFAPLGWLKGLRPHAARERRSWK